MPGRLTDSPSACLLRLNIWRSRLLAPPPGASSRLQEIATSLFQTSTSRRFCHYVRRLPPSADAVADSSKESASCPARQPGTRGAVTVNRISDDSDPEIQHVFGSNQDHPYFIDARSRRRDSHKLDSFRPVNSFWARQMLRGHRNQIAMQRHQHDNVWLRDHMIIRADLLIVDLSRIRWRRGGRCPVLSRGPSAASPVARTLAARLCLSSAHEDCRLRVPARQ